MNNKCPKCGAETKEKKIKEFCGLAGDNASNDETLKTCVNSDALKAAIESKFSKNDPCLDCKENTIVEEEEGTFSEVKMVKPPSKTTRPVFEETHICWQCNTKYKFINS